MNIKQLKSQSLLQEALCEALCELNDARLRNLAITKVELSAGKESAKVFLDENSFDTETAMILSALKKASGIIRANISAQLSWYKVPNLRFEIDSDLAQMNRLDEIFKKIHAKEGAESGVDSAESQNLIKNNSCEAPKNSPASWCKKSESKGAEVPPADFLLEAEKRGTPPKSEKRQLLARRGSEVGGAALLREKTSEIDKKNGVRIAESSAEPQSGLPRRFCESARNDEILDSSLRKCFAQNDKNKDFAESALDSAFSPHSNTKKTK